MKKVTGVIVGNVRRLAKADHISVCLPPGFPAPRLSVTENGDTRLLRISCKVAEVLIAQGMAYQG